MTTAIGMPDCGKFPFYKPLSAEDFRRVYGEKATIPGGLDFARPGWDLSYFSVRIGGERITDIGFIRPPFAVACQPMSAKAMAYAVTHLPSGQKIALTASREIAAQIAEAISPITDWNEVTVRGAPRAVIEAFYRTMAEAGFREEMTDLGDEFYAIVWMRDSN